MTDYFGSGSLHADGGETGARSTDDTDHSLNAEKKNGVYLLEVFSRPNPSEISYKVQSASWEAWVRSVRFNGQYIGIDERIEFECQDFEIDDGVLEVAVGEKDSVNPDECYSCQGRGYIKRRYGTAGHGPAKITKRQPCPDCDGTGGVDPSDTGGGR